MGDALLAGWWLVLVLVAEGRTSIVEVVGVVAVALLRSDRQQRVLVDVDAVVLHATEPRGGALHKAERQPAHRGKRTLRVDDVLGTIADPEAVVVHHECLSFERRDAVPTVDVLDAGSEPLGGALCERVVAGYRGADKERRLVGDTRNLDVGAETVHASGEVPNRAIEVRGRLRVGERDVDGEAAVAEVRIEVAPDGEGHTLPNVECPDVLVVLARLPRFAVLHDSCVVLAAVVLPVPDARMKGVADMADDRPHAVVVAGEQVAAQQIPQLVVSDATDGAAVVTDEQRDTSYVATGFDDVSCH